MVASPMDCNPRFTALFAIARAHSRASCDDMAVMEALRKLGVVLLVACGCAPAGARPGAAPPAAASAAAARQQLVDQVTQALRRGDPAAAAEAVERARHQVPAPSAQLLAYLDATVHSYQEDFQGAARVMNDHVAKAGATTQDAFAFHDAMIALRTADGDLLGALVECEEMTEAGTLGTWRSDDGDRLTTVRLKQHWHRAYLLRMIAQTLAGAEREAFLGYAERARQAYVALAAPLGTLGDSIAVLDGYFALCDGDPARMRDAAHRVHVAEDDDVEDLYLVQVALDGAGDHAAAAAVRARIRALPFVTVLTPVMLAWMRADEADPALPARFSPKHPTGTRPSR